MKKFPPNLPQNFRRLTKRCRTFGGARVTRGDELRARIEVLKNRQIFGVLGQGEEDSSFSLRKA